MKRLTLVGIGVLAVANAFALIHVALNRQSTPEAELVLTDREVRAVEPLSRDENSGMSLELQWTSPTGTPYTRYFDGGASGHDREIDQSRLIALGFDCSVSPDSDGAARFYQRQRPRDAYVALEYDGPAWKEWLAAYQKELERERSSGKIRITVDRSNEQSRLTLIDVDLDPAALRRRHPERNKVVIVRAVVTARLDPWVAIDQARDKAKAYRVIGYMRPVESSIHLSRPFSDKFRGHRPAQGWQQWHADNQAYPPYRVHMRWGADHEPYITGVEFGAPQDR